MNQIHNKSLVPFAKSLRKNMTKEERHLWYDFLRNYPVKILRQKIIGNYIADFYCACAKIVIELDGSQHYETQKAIDNDKCRNENIEQYGIKVIHIQNTDVNNNFEGVCDFIDNAIKQSLSQLR